MGVSTIYQHTKRSGFIDCAQRNPIPIFFIKEVFKIDDYIEDIIYDYDDYIECQEGSTEEVFAVEKDIHDLSSSQLAVSLAFAEEIADTEMAAYRVEHGIDDTDIDRPIFGTIERVSLKANTKSKVNLNQRDPHFLDYVKQTCNGGDVNDRVNTSWEDIF